MFLFFGRGGRWWGGVDKVEIDNCLKEIAGTS